MTYGGSGSPQPLTFVPGDVPADDTWQYAVGDASFSDLQTAFPTGVYQFDLTGDGQPSTSVQVDYTGDAFSNVPFITNFSALAGLDASSQFVVDLNTYVPGSTATGSLIFFSIFNSLDNVVFSTTGSGLPDTTTSITIPGGKLAAGQTYTFDLLFDNRIVGTDDLSGLPVTQFYDTHTDGTFTTSSAGAVSEPSTWAMMLVGFAGIGYAGYRSARRKSVAAA